MPEEFRAKLDGSETYRLYHVPVVSYYLRSARQYGLQAEQEQETEERLLASISAIMYSAMALEAFVNERAEDELPSEEREDFDKCRGKYQRKKGVSSVTHRYGSLLAAKFNRSAPLELSEAIEVLVSRRNTLVHYKRNETAGKVHLPGPKIEQTETGMRILWSLVEKPVGIDPPFIQMIDPEAAAQSHNTALAAIRFWLVQCGAESQLDGYEEIRPNNSLQPNAPPPDGRLHVG